MKRKEAEGRAEGREKGGRREGGRKEEEGGRDLEGPGRAEPRRGSKSQGLASGSGGTEATLEESGVSLGFGQNRANARRVELQPPPPRPEIINAHGSLYFPRRFSSRAESQAEPSLAVRV